MCHIDIWLLCDSCRPGFVVDTEGGFAGFAIMGFLAFPGSGDRSGPHTITRSLAVKGH